MTDTKNKINRLYDLLATLKQQKDIETAAALRWAIFQLEQLNKWNKALQKCRAFIFNTQTTLNT